jgi:hypothetical protein
LTVLVPDNRYDVQHHEQVVRVLGETHSIAWLSHTQAGQAVLAKWHREGVRPRCTCVPFGAEMYVANRNGRYYVSRMPSTGFIHAYDCPAYEDTNIYSGASYYHPSVLLEGTAGLVVSRIDLVNHSRQPATYPVTTLFLPGLLDLIWERADLNRFARRRDGEWRWSDVRKRLLHACSEIRLVSQPLAECLLVPQTFEEASYPAAQVEQEAFLSAPPPRLVMAPVKEITPREKGGRIVLKHMPRTHFWCSRSLAARLAASARGCFDDSTHRALRPLMAILVVRAASKTGNFTVENGTLHRVNAAYIPCATDRQAWLCQRLAEEGREFMRPLRYDMPENQPLADYLLLDTGPSPHPVFVLEDHGANRMIAMIMQRNAVPVTVWDTTKPQSLQYPPCADQARGRKHTI